jgi:hypothetical protein
MSISGNGFVARRHVLGAIVSAGAMWSVLSVSTAAAPPVIPSSTAQTVLASHKALYNVTLISTRPGTDYQDVTGKMFLEFTDSCDAWTTNQKSLLRVLTDEGNEQKSRSVFSAWESKAGKGAGDVGTATYTKPERKTYNLPPHFLFQTAQQVKLIEYAQKGGHFLSGDMFDGSEGGGSARFNAVILKPSLDKAQGTVPSNPLLDSPRHRIRVAFYTPAGTDDDDSQSSGGSNQPEYEMTMTVHDNGVVSDYDYDYEDFSVHGQLVSILALPQPHC